MRARYQATQDVNSIEHACCYEAAVVDQAQPIFLGESVRFALVCECPSMDVAEQIASALNAAEDFP